MKFLQENENRDDEDSTEGMANLTSDDELTNDSFSDKSEFVVDSFSHHCGDCELLSNRLTITCLRFLNFPSSWTLYFIIVSIENDAVERTERRAMSLRFNGHSSHASSDTDQGSTVFLVSYLSVLFHCSLC